MSNRLPLPEKPGLPKKGVLLFAGFNLMGLIILLMLRRLFYMVESGAGESLAIAIVTITMLAAFNIFALGIGVACFVEWAVRKRRSVFKTDPEPGCLLEKFLTFWGQKEITPEQKEVPAENPERKVSPQLENLVIPKNFPKGTTMQDLDDWLAYINGRPSYGKKSSHSDTVRYRAIRDWKLMQANGTTVTLSQFLEERFGIVNETGMQCVPNSTFYGWWPDFVEDLNKFMEERLKKRCKIVSAPAPSKTVAGTESKS